MKQTMFFFLFFAVFKMIGVAQQYQSAGVIFRDNYVTVELIYNLKPCSGDGGAKSKFSLKITGNTMKVNLFLNWKMRYYNYHKSNTSIGYSFNIGKFASEGDNENMDWVFDGYKIA